jgi:hypothetical protein
MPGLGEEGRPDEVQRPLLAALIHTFELPDHDDRSEDLDQRVEAETSQRHGARRKSSGDHHNGPDDVPAERHVFQE